MRLFSPATLKGDATAGMTTAALALPVSIVLGIFTLAPLGPDRLSLGIVCGVYGAVLSSLLIVLLGNRTTAINVPRSVAGVFVATMLADAVLRYENSSGAWLDPELKLAAVFMFLAMSAAFQALIGLLRLGVLVKYCPHPVLAGFLNAVGLVLIASQLDDLLGFAEPRSLMQLAAELGQAKPLSLLVAAATLAGIWKGAALSTRIPPMITGLLAGTIAYHLFVAIGLQSSLGPAIGSMPALALPLDSVARFPALLQHPAFPQLLPSLVGGAFGLAIISSLDYLLNSKAYESYLHARIDGNREMARLGIANTLVACLGGIPCSMSLGASQLNHASGARTAISLVFCAVTMLLGMLAFSAVIGLVPQAVVAAMLVSIAWRGFDRPTFAMLKKVLLRQTVNRRNLAIDSAIMIVVALVAIAVGAAVAVAAGVAIAVLFFIINMSHSVIRRSYRADAVHSNRSRSADDMELIGLRGRRIVIFELEGVLFFGTADQLVDSIDRTLREEVTHIVLDMKRIKHVDTTGAAILIQIAAMVAASQARLMVAHVGEGEPLRDFFADTGVLNALGEAAFLADTDHALEAAEDSLIAARSEAQEKPGEIALRDLAPLQLLSESDLTLLTPKLGRREFAPGEYVFREGETGEELFIIARGSASVYRAADGSGRAHRLVTFDQGTVFGEMSLLDAQPRSASVRADGQLICYTMAREDLDALVAEQHPAAVKLLISLSRELGRRLRIANQTINYLQS